MAYPYLPVKHHDNVVASQGTPLFGHSYQYSAAHHFSQFEIIHLIFVSILLADPSNLGWQVW